MTSGCGRSSRRCATSANHLQYSIFECQFTPADLVRCRHALSEIIDHRDDQVLFVDLGPVEGRGDRVITALGKAYSPIDSPCIVVDGEDDSPCWKIQMRLLARLLTGEAHRYLGFETR